MLALGLFPVAGARAESAVPPQLAGSKADDHRGQAVDLDLEFTDEDGKAVRLRDFFAKGKPVLLTLNYYMCQMLCTETLNGLTEGLRGLEWTPGNQFELVTVSIDPREKPKLAFEKRKSYLLELGRQDANWHFLTGKQPAIDKLADEVGFRFHYDAETDQFAHPAVIMFLSPEGKVMQYLFGKQFPLRDLKFALMDASEGKVGSTFEQLVWSCFHYDETSGRYTPFAYGIMRIGGAATVLMLVIVLGVLWRRDRRETRRQGYVPQDGVPGADLPLGAPRLKEKVT